MIWREIPPTAGLLPRAADLIAALASHEDLEAAIAKFLGVSEVQLECSGTACLLVALEHLKTCSRRRTVIIPGYTCPLVALAARQAGLKVLACDTVRGGFDLDLQCLERLLDADTLCVVPTHYGGALTDVGAVRRFVEGLSPEVFIIEDAAQAFGARWNERSVGTSGHIGLFSFAAGKGFTLFEGGCLIAETKAIRDGLRAASARIVPRSWHLELRRCLDLIGYHLFYNPLGLRLTYGIAKRSWLARGDPVRAAADHFALPIPLHGVGAWRRHVGARALPRLAPHLAETNARFRAIVENLSRSVPTIDVHPPLPQAAPTGTFAFITFPSREACEQASGALWPTGLGFSKLFVHAIGNYPQLAGFVGPPTPNATDVAERTSILTTSGSLGPADFDLVVRVIQKSVQL